MNDDRAFLHNPGVAMPPMLNKGLSRQRAAVLLMLSALIVSPLCARELAVVVPPDDDVSTREFLAALSESPQVKEAGLTFKAVRSGCLLPESIAQPSAC